MNAAVHRRCTSCGSDRRWWEAYLGSLFPPPGVCWKCRSGGSKVTVVLALLFILVVGGAFYPWVPPAMLGLFLVLAATSRLWWGRPDRLSRGPGRAAWLRLIPVHLQPTSAQVAELDQLAAQYGIPPQVLAARVVSSHTSTRRAQAHVAQELRRQFPDASERSSGWPFWRPGLALLNRTAGVGQSNKSKLPCLASTRFMTWWSTWSRPRIAWNRHLRIHLASAVGSTRFSRGRGECGSSAGHDPVAL